MDRRAVHRAAALAGRAHWQTRPGADGGELAAVSVAGTGELAAGLADRSDEGGGRRAGAGGEPGSAGRPQRRAGPHQSRPAVRLLRPSAAGAPHAERTEESQPPAAAGGNPAEMVAGPGLSAGIEGSGCYTDRETEMDLVIKSCLFSSH